jgi:DNA-binding Lrp family transcriptional regulator
MDGGRFLLGAREVHCMVRAFIMVKAGTGHAEELVETVTALDTVSEAHVVAGEWDIIVEAVADEVYDIMHSAATDIRGLSDVSDTKTYICLE